MNHLLAEIRAALERSNSNANELFTQFKSRIEKLEQEAKAGRDVMGEAMKLIKDLTAALDAREDAESRGKNPSLRNQKGLGQTIFEHEDFATARKGSDVRFALDGRSLLQEYKTTLGTNQFADSPSSTIPIQALRLDGIANDPRRRLTLFDILPRRPVSGTNAYEYLKLNDAYAPNAAVVAEGASKPEANIPVSLETGNLVTIANHIPVTNQLLSDFPAIRSWIEDLLLYACLVQLESQIIVGASSSITGLLEIAPTPMTNTKTSRADKIGEAAAHIALLGWNPNTVLLNPLDEFEIESEKASGGNEQYVSPPSGGKFWRLTPVATPTVPQGTALVFDRSQGSLVDREQIGVAIGTVGNQFTENKRTILLEGRFGFYFSAASAIKRVGF
jgi:HK97 family phage major capsid protein